MNYLAERKLAEPLDFLKTVPMSSRKLFSSEPYQKLDVNVLLHQMGILLIRSINKPAIFQLGAEPGGRGVHGAALCERDGGR